VCVCFGITEDAIERAIRENGLTTVEEVTNYTKAGGGCGGCVEDIEAILKRVVGTPATEPVAKPPPKRLTNIQKMRLIEETIEREVRPQLRKDGGDIELLDIAGDRVGVSMLGSCANCPVSRFTLAGVVEAKLREFVSENLVVVEGETDEGVSG